MVEGVKVPRKEGETALKLLKKLGLVNAAYKIAHSDDHILIPLKRSPEVEERAQLAQSIGPFEETTFQPTPRHARKTTLNILGDRLPPHLLASVPRSIDIVGHIAIVELPPELAEHESVVGETVLEAHPRLRTVLAKAGKVGGDYRLREYRLIAGEDRTETLHMEYGCRLALDISKVYFSPRLAGEHWRVSRQAREGEVVVDMFAGVGPFSIMIARARADIKIYAIDANPDAVAYLERNIQLNRVEGKVIPILGEADRVVEEGLKGIADRVIMNLPEKALEFIAAACNALRREGGMIHFYEFAAEPNPVEKTEGDLRSAVEGAGRRIKQIYLAKTVKATAPREWQVVVDAFII
jgi:tRNA (guanine37-N1)-methyltransferase